MALRRACSYQANIKTPKAPSEYSAMLVTFQQKQQNIINLSLSDTDNLELGDEMVTVKLDQEQTKLFEAGVQVFLQLRCYKSQFEAPGSKVWTLDVYPALNDTILPEV